MAQPLSLPPSHPCETLGPRPGSLEPWAMKHDRSIDKLFDSISIVSDIPSRVSNFSKLQDSQISKLRNFQISKAANFQSSKVLSFQDSKIAKHFKFLEFNSPKLFVENDLGLVLGFVQKIWHVQIDKEGFLRVPKIRTAWTSSVSGLQSVKLGFDRCPVKQNYATFMWEIPSQYLCQWK